jgi:hypothetical protein
MDRIVSQLLAEIDACQGGAGDLFIMGAVHVVQPHEAWNSLLHAGGLSCP